MVNFGVNSRYTKTKCRCVSVQHWCRFVYVCLTTVWSLCLFCAGVGVHWSSPSDRWEPHLPWWAGLPSLLRGLTFTTQQHFLHCRAQTISYQIHLFNGLIFCLFKTAQHMYLGYSGWFLSMTGCQRGAGVVVRGLDHWGSRGLHSAGRDGWGWTIQADLSLTPRDIGGGQRRSNWRSRLGFGGALRALCLWGSGVWFQGP